MVVAFFFQLIAQGFAIGLSPCRVLEQRGAMPLCIDLLRLAGQSFNLKFVIARDLANRLLEEIQLFWDRQYARSEFRLIQGQR